MKKIKRLLLIFIAIMFNITGYCQQTTVSIGSITVTKTGDSVIVPVNVTNFNSIGSFGFWIKIDTNVMINYPNDTACLENIYPACRSGLISYFAKAGADGPTLGIAYSASNNNFTISDGLLFNLRFQSKKGDGTICFDTSYCSIYSDNSGTLTNVKYICGTITNTASIDELGIMNDESGIKVYPNPVKDFTNISLHISSQTELQSKCNLDVYNYLSQKVYSNFYTKEQLINSIRINTSGFARGIYLLRISGEGLIFTRKISKV